MFFQSLSLIISYITFFRHPLQLKRPPTLEEYENLSATLKEMQKKDENTSATLKKMQEKNEQLVSMTVQLQTKTKKETQCNRSYAERYGKMQRNG